MSIRTKHAEFIAFIDSLGLDYFSGEELARYFESVRGSVRNSAPPKQLWKNLVEPLRILDAAREVAGSPVRITSSYRSDAYNKAVGGAHNSFHRLCYALDSQCPGIGNDAWFHILRDMRRNGVWTGGLGRYRNFVHIDTATSYNRDWTS